MKKHSFSTKIPKVHVPGMPSVKARAPKQTTSLRVRMPKVAKSASVKSPKAGMHPKKMVLPGIRKALLLKLGV